MAGREVDAAPARSITLGELLIDDHAPSVGAGAPASPVDYYSGLAFAAGVPEEVAAGAIDARAHAVSPGDVLVSCATAQPRRAWMVGAERGRPQVASGEWLPARHAEFDPRYLRHLLVSNAFHLQFERSLARLARRPPRVLRAHIAHIGIACPPLEHQRQAADMLDAVDRLRALRGTTLALVDMLPAGIFTARCGAGAPGEAWPCEPLAALCTISPSRGVNVAPGAHGEWLLVDAASVARGRVEPRIDKRVAIDREDAVRYGVEDGDVLLRSSGAWPDALGCCAIAQPGPALWTFHASLIRLRFDAARVEPQYATHWFASRAGRIALATITRRARARFNIAPEDLGRLQLPLPPLASQRELADAHALCNALRPKLLRSGLDLDALLGVLRDRAYRATLALA